MAAPSTPPLLTTVIHNANQISEYLKNPDSKLTLKNDQLQAVQGKLKGLAVSVKISAI